jgi:hypothetical protein
MRLGVVLLAVVSQQVALRSRRPCVCLGSSHAPIKPVRPILGPLNRTSNRCPQRYAMSALSP